MTVEGFVIGFIIGVILIEIALYRWKVRLRKKWPRTKLYDWEDDYELWKELKHNG